LVKVLDFETSTVTIKKRAWLDDCRNSRDEASRGVGGIG
jgi:hypothetical protein